jgi:hypothetical protein
VYDFLEFFRDFAFMPKFPDDIDDLSQLAEFEAWDYLHSPSPHPHPILRNYITYTYRSIAKEKKINITPDEEHCCWNAGLITQTQEPIFILFSKNKFPNASSYWHFWKFARKGEWELNRFLAHAGIEAAAFPGTEKDYAARERSTLRGPMTPLLDPNSAVVEHGLVEQALEFVRRNTPIAVVFENGRRIEKPTYPPEVLREAERG